MHLLMVINYYHFRIFLHFCFMQAYIILQYFSYPIHIVFSFLTFQRFFFRFILRILKLKHFNLQLIVLLKLTYFVRMHLFML